MQLSLYHIAYNDTTIPSHPIRRKAAVKRSYSSTSDHLVLFRRRPPSRYPDPRQQHSDQVSCSVDGCQISVDSSLSGTASFSSKHMPKSRTLSIGGAPTDICRNCLRSLRGKISEDKLPAGNLDRKHRSSLVKRRENFKTSKSP